MKKIFACLLLVMGSLFITSCGGDGGKETKKQDIIVEFEGATSITVTEEGEYDLPTLSLEAGQYLLGWALKPEQTKALFKDSITFNEISDYSSDGKLKLYPVIESRISVTLKGISQDKTTALSNITLNQAELPLVAESERQQFLGWSTVENAEEAQILAGSVINFNTVQRLATNAQVTLYPVVLSYDILIGVHGSHSNGNIYVSTEQRVELRLALEAAFPGAKILIEYFDGVNAEGFATQAIKKDYDICLTSKTARGTLDDLGDIAVAASNAGKTMYAEADKDETTLSTIDFNQSRQVCRILGTEADKPYQDDLYTFFTTPIDKVVNVTFVNGEASETIEVHRVVDGALNLKSYEPTAAITSKVGKVFDGWTTVLGGTEVEFANASYSNVYKLANEGALTLYPVFKNEPDCYILVWGMNGENEYVSHEQYENIVSLFNTYLTEHSISKDGKDVQIVYFEGKTADFQSELTKSYVSGAVGASALNNDTYAQYWTIDQNKYAKVTNVQCTNTSRYVALRDTFADDQFALAFFNALCESKITVKFSNGVTTSEGFIANSLEGNVVALPDAFAPAVGKVLSGYALTQDGEVVITGNVTYKTCAEFATGGEVTLFPIYENDSNYDLTVAILRGTATKTYITLDEIEAIKTEFVTFAASKGYQNVNVEYIVNDGAAGADFIAALPGTTDVYVGASNLTSQGGFPGMYGTESWAVIVNMLENESRYCGVVATCDSTQAELAKLFVEMLTVVPTPPLPPVSYCECVVAYHSYGSNTTTTYFDDTMLAKVQADVAQALADAGYQTTDYKITWKPYSGKVAPASASITTDGADVCIAHTQVFNASKTDTPFVCAESAPAIQFSSDTAGETFYCSSALKVGVSENSASNAVALIIYSVFLGYTK